MSKRLAVTALAILLTIAIAVPATLFIAPQKVSAQSSGGCVGGAIGGMYSFIMGASGLGIRTAPSDATGNAVTTGATVADCVFKLIIVPLGQELVRQILRDMTASIINWINGGNGTGQPSFVQNLSRHLQQLGDSIAMPFISLAQRVSNPAFQAAMASSLIMNYAMGSSVGGYLAGNQGTLARYSPNQVAFLAGNWSQGGGTPAWFALTTQNNNNPFITIPKANDQLMSLINQASINRRQDLSQSGGFMSWCGVDDPVSTTAAGINPSAKAPGGCAAGSSIKTPGTVIQKQVEQSLGSDMAQLINAKDIDSSIAQIFGAVVRQGMNSIFGQGGLLGASQPSSIRPQAITSAIQGASATNSAAITSANTAANAALSRLSTYTTAWTAIGNAASSAKSSITLLKANCTAQAGAADTALVSVNAVLAQAQVAMSTVSGTQALALQVQTDAQDTTAAGATKLSTDMQTLAAAPPTTVDVSSANASALASTPSGAVASPTGSLAVSGGTLVDQMTLIGTNATAMITNPVACPVVAPTIP